MTILGIGLLLLSLAAPSAAATEQTSFARTQDMIYGRPDGTALTMDYFEPTAKANGACVIWLVSGGWFSSHDGINTGSLSPVVPLISKGYRVYAVVHRSSPRFTVEDAVDDVHRAVRFVRNHEAEEGRTTTPIGIMGASAGGHLSLIAGTTGDDGDKKSKDPLGNVSNRVQAVACFFPPTDFLNYGDTNVDVMETTVGKFFPASFDFQRQEKITKQNPKFSPQFDDVTTPALHRKILSEVSPADHVTSDDAPALIMHGDKDQLVPLQQSELMVKKLKAAGVDAKLVVKKDGGHGWQGLDKDYDKLIDWFDDHLLKVKSSN